MKYNLPKIIATVMIGFMLGLTIGYSSIYKENMKYIQECEAVLPRYQECKITALPVPEEPK